MSRILAGMAIIGILVGVVPAQAGKASHPVLGGTLRSWVAAWGRYDANETGFYTWSRCPAPSTVEHYLVTIVTSGAIVIVGQICNGDPKPSNAANVAAASAFFPKDYKARGRVKTDQGTDLLYYSASLAKTNAAKMWGQDCNQVNVNPGLFTLSPDSDGGGDWQLAIGTCA
jgi:hypothetical protein